MCTSLALGCGDFYFGRNMDLHYHFGEQIAVVPRFFELSFKEEKSEKQHYAFLGMASVKDGYPLFADGMNEKGLCISALNFEGNTFYGKRTEGKINLAPYEIIPYILANCATVKEAHAFLEKAYIIDTPFSKETGVSPLHWHIADRGGSIVLEQTADGLKVFANPVGILTNNPPFPFHLANLDHYKHLSPYFENEEVFGAGLSAFGLPGDYSSTSRFVKLAFLKNHVLPEDSEKARTETVFRLLSAVAPLKGCVYTKDKKPHYTIYTAVMNATEGVYYYNTYENMETTSVSLENENLNSDILITHTLNR